MKLIWFGLALLCLPMISCGQQQRIEPVRCNVLFIDQKQEREVRALLILFAEKRLLSADFGHRDSLVLSMVMGKKLVLTIDFMYSFRKVDDRPFEKMGELSAFTYGDEEFAPKLLKRFDDFFASEIAKKYSTKTCGDVPGFIPTVEFR